MLPIGSKAPDFKLKLDSGKIFKLADFYNKKNVIISFFPGGLSDTDTQDIFIFLQHLQKVQLMGTEVVAINPKNSDELQSLFNRHKIKLPIAADPTLEVCRNYHAFWLRGLGIRKITYIIDKNGYIRGRLNHHLLTEKSWIPVMRLLKELSVKDQRKP